MEGNSRGEPRKTRRTAQACVACRQSKIKCSGEDPCRNCKRRAINCHFVDGGDKVMVSEKYLQDLQKQVEEHQRSLSSSTQSQATDRFRSPVPPVSAPRLTESQFRSPVAQSSVVSQASSDRYISPIGPSPEPRQDHASVVHNGVPTQGQQPYTSPSLSLAMTRVEGNMRQGQSSDASYQFNTNGNGEHRNNHSLVSPATTAIEPAKQPDGGAIGPSYQSPLGVWSNAFIMPSKVIKNIRKDKRTWLWLAPWSTWSFTIRLIITMSEKLHPEDPSIPSRLLDPEIYDMTWKTSSSAEMPDISGLPSLHHAVYLFNTVKFHLGQTYRLFDEAEFETQIHDFYSIAQQKASDNRLWYVKFLLMLAFGTAFHAAPTNTKEPPGSKFFTRAMALMPETNLLWRDSLLAIEVLALAALYLFSIDERESAYIYLVQAIRIAQLEGLHTQLPEAELGEHTVTYCQGLWWTLYIMDRHFSSSVGLPMSVQDSDITTPVNPPNVGTRGDSARSLQVNLSHLLSVILTTVYKPHITPLDTFLEQTRSILHTLAHHAQEIEKIIYLKFQNSVGGMSQETCFLTLLYHQCVIVATRPLLLSVLKERLDILGHPSDQNWENFLLQTGTLISTGIKSAAKTLQILTGEHSPLEAFLPYDVEFTYGAALHLTMANALFPDEGDYQQCRQWAHQILDDLTSRGNRVARARKAELSHIEILFQELAAKIQQEGHQMLQLLYPEGTVDLSRRTGSEQGSVLPSESEQSEQSMGMNTDSGLHMTSNMEFLDNIGISSEDFLSIVQQIGDPENLPDSMLTVV